MTQPNSQRLGPVVACGHDDPAFPNIEESQAPGYEFDGRKVRIDPGSGSLEFKKDRFVSSQNGKSVEWAYHLEDLGDRFRIALFKANVDELADGFKYSSAGLIKVDGETLILATPQGANKEIPTEFAAPKGSNVLVIEFKRAK